MPLIINLRHLENRNLALRGELPLTDLEFDARDAMIRAAQPLHYDLEIELLDDAVLVQGLLRLKLDCQCVRCLKNFEFELELDPWTLHLPFEPLEGEALTHEETGGTAKTERLANCSGAAPPSGSNPC